MRTRGEERREELPRDLGGDTLAVVNDHELQPRALRTGQRGAHLQLQHPRVGRRVFHGLDGVAREVEQHLLDHGAVAQRRRQPRRHAADQAHAVGARLQVDQWQHGAQQGLGGYGFACLAAAAHQAVHALHHAARARSLVGNVLHGTAQVLQQGVPCVGIAGIVMGQQIEGAGGVAGYRGQGLIDFMAQERGHLSHRGEVGRCLQPFLRGARLRLDASLRTHVQHRAHPALVPALRIKQRGFENEHIQARAVLAQVLRLQALVRRLQ